MIGKILPWLVLGGVIIWVVTDPSGAASFVKALAGGFSTFIGDLAS